MKKEENSLKISDFYPKELIIQQVHNEVDSILIDGYVKSAACSSDWCGIISEHQHGTVGKTSRKVRRWSIKIKK